MPKSIDEILAEVTDVYRRVLENPSVELNEATTAADVEGWDSLNHMTLIAEVEKRFGTKFSLREVMRFKNVGDMCKLLQTKVGS